MNRVGNNPEAKGGREGGAFFSRALRLFIVAWLCGFLSVFPGFAVKYMVYSGGALDDTHLTLFRSLFGFPTIVYLGFGTLLGIGVYFVVILVPGLTLLRRVLRGRDWSWAYPVVGSLLGPLVLLLMCVVLPRSPESPLIPPDAMVMMWTLAVSGYVAGLGFLRIRREMDAEEAGQPKP